MRKLTGYIGALVIVFTLVGTIGLGYALNVTNEDVTRDKYDLVTDVSGLYSHSQEKTYIDYNPASNYTGYSLRQSDSFTITNTTTLDYRLSFKVISGNDYNTAWNNNDYVPGAFYVNGNVVPFSTAANNVLADIYPILTGENVRVFIKNPQIDSAIAEIGVYNGSWSRNWSNNISFTYSSNVLTINDLQYGNTWTVNTPWIARPSSDGDRYAVIGENSGYFTLPNYGPYYDSSTSSVTYTPVYEINGHYVYGVYRITPAINNWAFVVKSYEYEPLNDNGINYSESDRANNYLVSSNSGTTNGSINLTSGMNNQSRPVNFIRLDSMYNGAEFNYQTDYAGDPPRPIRIQYDRYNYTYKDPYCTNLTTVLNNIPVEIGATSIEISNKTNTPITTPTFNSEGWPAEYVDYGARMDYNAVWFYVAETPLYSGSQSIYAGNLVDNAWTNTLGSSEKIIYDITRGTADLYVNDVKIGTYSPNDIKIMYGGTQIRQTIHYDSARPVTQTDTITATDNYSFAPTPITTLTWKQYYEQVHYMDPTKGVSIKNDTTSTWSNGYENCDIQILFRMENLNGVYQNTIKVGSDTITVNSHDGNFYVEINNDGAVNIGNWRNIVLDIDCLNGEVKVYPVRTFNNYTNVVLYGGADVFVGNLNDRNTVTSIDIGASNNSFKFLIYNTKVFMDTYGAVMIDPILNVNDYFTNLNGFYKITLKNFTLTGGSITINDYTYDVNDGKINIDNSTQKLANMEIMYKSGKTNVLFKDTDTNVDLGDTVSYVLSFSGSWYFESYLYAGSEYTDKEYVWHFEEFVIDNSQFVVIYLGLMAVSFVVARKFCTFTITDYIVMIASIIIIMGVQVIA